MRRVSESSWGISALARVARALPPGSDGAAATLAAWLARRIRPEREAAARANAALLFPALGSRTHGRLARDAGAAYARFVIEYLRHLGIAPETLARRVRFDPHPGIVDALADGRGLVACTAHVGNWELGALALTCLGRPVTVVARPQFLPSWRPAVREAKESAGIRVIAPEGATPILTRALEEGGIVGLLVDGDGYSRGRPARLAGQGVALPFGPARLAAATGAVLAGGTCLRVGPDRFAARLVPLGGTEHGPIADSDLLHREVAAWLEGVLLAHPGAWCVFRPFFAPIAPAAPAARTAPTAPTAPAGGERA